MAATKLTCFCHGACPYPHPPNGTCTLPQGGYCFASITEVHDTIANHFEPEWTFGCLPADEAGLMQCKGDLSPHQVQKSIKCCHNEDLCNLVLKPSYEKTIIPPEPGWFDNETEYNLLLTSLVAITLIGFALILFILFLLWRRRYNSQQYGSSQGSIMSIEKNVGDLDDSRTNSSSVQYGLRSGFDMSSGSGSGMPLLIQRSLAKDINLIECIGKGRYGECWRANWLDEEVAVKRFFSHEEKSWRRETEIYNTSMMRHDNILAYLGSDVTSIDSCTQFWVVSQYHPLGSLYDFLLSRPVTIQQGMQILSSAVGGLLHLHTAFRGTNAKPAIAHRDIKSKNILIKSPTVACICDFGLAISHESTGDLNGPLNADMSNDEVGTKRYMAPEILSRSMKMLPTNEIETLKNADIYSFALVMWETMRRSLNEPMVKDKTIIENDIDLDVKDTMDIKFNYEEYKVPFYDVVPSDPSFEDMRKVVVTDGYRPQIPDRWNSNWALVQVAEVIKECWKPNPAARLSALRIKKSLNRIIREYCQD